MDVALLGLLVTPIIIFMVIVAPIWLILHYRSKNKISQGLTEQEALQFREIVQQAEQLKERVRSLERILDQEHPDWRKYN